MVCLQIANFLPIMSLFSVVNDIQSSAATLHNDLSVISNWAFQWKIIFNLDLTKQAQEVIFSRNTRKLLHSCLLFNDVPVRNSKTMGLLHRFQPILPRSSLLTIYKTFVWSQTLLMTKLVTPPFIRNSNLYNTLVWH